MLAACGPLAPAAHSPEAGCRASARRIEEGTPRRLVVLHEENVTPFDHGCEGTPLHDFIGRLDDWEWPVE